MNITKIALAVLLFFSIQEITAQHQEEPVEYQRFPVIVGVQFQNFAMHLKDMGSNFDHQGIFLGTELRLNKKGTLAQNAIVGAYRNKEIGDGIYFYSQFTFRPQITKNIFLGLKGGAGILYIDHPVPAYEFKDGAWKEVTGGKTQLIIPFEVSAAYAVHTSAFKILPFVSYQVTPALFYNQTLPLNIYSNIQAGIQINFKKQ